MRMPRRAALSVGSVLLLLPLAACASTDSNAGIAPSSARPSASTPGELTDSGSSFGEPSGLWDIPRDVQVAYFKAICTAPAERFGYAGRYDDSTGTCLTSNGMESDLDFVMRGLLASDEEQMLQSTQFMVTQVGVPVEGCPTLEEYTTVADLTITNDCVIAAMRALSGYLSD